MSETVKVPLSNGTELEIGEMSLQGWFLMKREIMSLLSDEASQSILSVILGEVQGEGEVNLDYTSLANALPRLIGLLIQVVDTNTLFLAEECCTTPPDVPLEKARLRATDGLKLREAVIATNDFMEFLRLEKNSLIAAIPQEHRKSIDETFSKLSGMFNSNLSSPEPTAGPPQ
jgi:hypothetical protein